jgi:catechol 2,3-dioxygenase-like lactoylglutathione lyase family enzyme
MTIQRMDNVGIVVEDLDVAIAFFTELGMVLDGKAHIEGIWATAPSDSTASAVTSRRCGPPTPTASSS